MNEQHDVTPSRAQWWRLVIGLLWVGSVVMAYYGFNWQYYVEKITVFGRFLFR